MFGAKYVELWSMVSLQCLLHFPYAEVPVTFWACMIFLFLKDPGVQGRVHVQEYCGVDFILLTGTHFPTRTSGNIFCAAEWRWQTVTDNSSIRYERFMCRWSYGIPSYMYVEVALLGPGEYIYLSFAISEYYDHYRVFPRFGSNQSQEIQPSPFLPVTNATSGTQYMERSGDGDGSGTVTVLLAGTNPALYSQRFVIQAYRCPRAGVLELSVTHCHVTRVQCCCLSTR